MPSRSEAQRRFIFGTKGEAFARRHHFANKGKLPEHVTPAKAMKHARRRRKKR